MICDRFRNIEMIVDKLDGSINQTANSGTTPTGNYSTAFLLLKNAEAVQVRAVLI